jgi:hypothetical protein
MTKPPRALNAGEHATRASGPPKPMMETAEVIAAERAFAEARVAAEMRKQAAMGAAMRLKGQAHVDAIKAAERAYHTALADAADRTGGLIGSAGYKAAAAAA